MKAAIVIAADLVLFIILVSLCLLGVNVQTRIKVKCADKVQSLNKRNAFDKEVLVSLQAMYIITP